MAIYHLSVTQGSRAKQKSAGEKFDYVARLGEAHKRLDHLLHAQDFWIPTWADTPRKFWMEADKNERSNARVYTEIEIALPKELDLKKNISLVNDFIDKNLHGCPTSYGIHYGKGWNPHVHIIFSERKWDNNCFDREVFFQRNGAKKDRKFSDIKWVDSVRKEWEVTANIALEENAGGISIFGKKIFQDKFEKIDCRSNKDRGLGTSGKKLGARGTKKLMEYEKNGKITTDGNSALSERRREFAQGYSGRASALYFDARKMRQKNSPSGRDARRKSDGGVGHHPAGDQVTRRGPGRPRKETGGGHSVLGAAGAQDHRDGGASRPNVASAAIHAALARVGVPVSTALSPRTPLAAPYRFTLHEIDDGNLLEWRCRDPKTGLVCQVAVAENLDQALDQLPDLAGGVNPPQGFGFGDTSDALLTLEGAKADSMYRASELHLNQRVQDYVMAYSPQVPALKSPFECQLAELRARVGHISGSRLLLESSARKDFRDSLQQVFRGQTDAVLARLEDMDMRGEDLTQNEDYVRFAPVRNEYSDDAKAIAELDQLAASTRYVLDRIGKSHAERQHILDDRRDAQKRLEYARWSMRNRNLDMWDAARKAESEAESEIALLNLKIHRDALEIGNLLSSLVAKPEIMTISPSTQAAVNGLKKDLQRIQDHHDRKTKERIDYESARKRAQGIGRPGSGYRRGGASL